MNQLYKKLEYTGKEVELDKFDKFMEKEIKEIGHIKAVKLSVMIAIYFLILIGAFWKLNTTEANYIPLESVIDRESFCDNLQHTNYDRYKTDCKEFHVVTKNILDDEQGYYNTIKWGRYRQPIRVYDTRVNTMIENWYSLTKVIDLTTLLTMECNKYSWKCINTSDVWPFQINRIAHKAAYLRSKELFYNSSALFKYQLHYANNNIVQRLEDQFCGWKYTTSNEIRFKCIAKNYNWNKKIYSNWKEWRENYKILAWAKRKEVARYIVDNFPLLTN